MTENEAIKILKTDSCDGCTHATNSPIACEYGACRVAEATRIAIKALEEVQKYRAIGTPKECRKSVEICKAMLERNITTENMEEYMKFEDDCAKRGFTFDSLLEAREKQTAKKIEIFNGQASCPNCKRLFGEMDIIKNLRAWNMPNCKDCGQKLDWSDEE